MNALPYFTRREILATMSSGIGWLAFSALAQERQAFSLAARAPHHPARAKRVIFLTMRGGPSHVDLWDHKPELIKRNGQTATLGRDSTNAKLFGPITPLQQRGQSGQWMSPCFPNSHSMPMTCAS